MKITQETTQVTTPQFTESHEMTIPTDKVLALAREVGTFDDIDNLAMFTPEELTRFAALIQREMEAENAELRKALYEISLCSQNSMSSKSECGRIARAAIDRARSANDKG